MIYGYIIGLTLAILFPVVAVIAVLRRIKVNLWLLTAGIVAYIASQVIYFPLQLGYLFLLDKVPATWADLTPSTILLAFLGALLIAVSEDLVRWLLFKFLKKNAEPKEAGTTIGLGFAAIASVAMGIVMFTEFNYMLQVTTPNLIQNLNLSPAELETLKVQQALYAATPWYEPATRGFIFLITFIIQVLFAIMIWKGVSGHSWKWLVGAFGSHLVFEFIILLLQKFSPGPWMNVLVVLLFGSFLTLILYRLLFKQWIFDSQTVKAAATKD